MTPIVAACAASIGHCCTSAKATISIGIAKPGKAPIGEGIAAGIAGVAGMAGNVPEIVMLAFVLAAKPRIGFIVVAMTLHVGARARSGPSVR